ncbi:serine hydrolase domain-containing protein [Kibdelosporangium phytohabitans]|uniref:Penicillin-binding protein n=1 Tax=Kibdelosporangium phytohabitans TaxID=860235 RepID=A0A0N7F4Z6_9PSEU|nr:serine hydrolase domain-containing protein [Kibdelosporangium phytohabitans]ALG12815.1 penicillin-binding protein [Kibdelosporangium phytohabitans]MBE1464505.1 CubicO group peptidase (beta-lactamase class C family) [Kibdelosporangium phytohabitans]
MNTAHWQQRLDDLRAEHRVPGAGLAILADGEIHELASGVLHRATGVEATPDSVYQLGSIAKVYTATLVMTLAEEGKLDLDAPVVDVLPEFTTADPHAARVITPRQLLSHTSGLTCDFVHDTGRGDDCLAKYVEAAEDVALDCPPGVAVSYSSVGMAVLGRIAEVLTCQTWDQALRERVFQPLGLTHSMTLPEEALSFRAAMSHLGEPGAYPDPAPAWDLLPRSAGPGARVIASAGDIVRFAKAHLDGGAGVLEPETVAAMQKRVVDVPDKWTVSADGWGLGWTLYDWDGRFGYGHDGAAVGQYAYLRVIPDSGVAIALTTNGGGARQLYYSLFSELFAELAGITLPEPFAAPAQPPAVTIGKYAGTYRREGVVITVDENAHLTYEFVDGMKGLAPTIESDMVPVSETVWAAGGAGPSFSEGAMPVVFAELDGHDYCYVGMRAAPKTS